MIREHNVYDSFGRLIREVDYNASGTVIANNDAAAVDTIFGYTGRDFDSDTGLQYNRARWYAPQTGRWLSQDPIGFAAGDANLYRYVGNHPAYANDPSGLQEPRQQLDGIPDWARYPDPYVMGPSGMFIANPGYRAGLKPSLADWLEERRRKDAFSRPYSDTGYCEIGPESQWSINRKIQEQEKLEAIKIKQEIDELQVAALNLLAGGRGAAALPLRRGAPLPRPPRIPVVQYPRTPVAPPIAPKGPIAVTDDMIRNAMKNAPLNSQQRNGVSRANVQKYVDMILSGKQAPPIKVDGNMIVDGNHRYIAGRICGVDPPIQPWAGGRPGRIVPWNNIPIDPAPWP